MILRIDTSDNKVTEVKLITDKKTFKKETKQTFGSQALLNLIEKVLKEVKVTKDQLDGIEVEAGPGSFTGLRVGVSVANALGYSLGIPVNSKKIETEINY